MRYALICILLVFSSFITSCEYRDHYLSQQTKGTTVGSGEEMIQTLSGGALFLLPDLGVLETMKQKIRNATTTIWIEVYTWTEKSLLDVVIEAKRRGVDVRVVLEGNVFGLPEVNTPVYQALKNAGIPVVYADNKKFTFTHAKFWIIDDEYFISTGNLSYSAFSKNRELLFYGTHLSIRDALRDIFLADFSHKPLNYTSSGPLLVGPEFMREPIESILKGAKQSIRIYIQSLTDDEILSILRKQSRNSIKVNLCVADKGEEDEGYDEIVDSLSGTTIAYKRVKKPYPHLKLFIIDDRIVFVGSTNFTNNALENNREVGVFFTLQKENVKVLNQISSNECELLK